MWQLASNLDPNSFNLAPDPAENMNPDPDPNCVLSLLGINIKLFILNMLNRHKKSIERHIFQSVMRIRIHGSGFVK